MPTEQIYKLPTWWFPFSKYGIIGFFTVQSYDESGMPIVCCLTKASGSITLAWWQGEWCIIAGFQYDQVLLDRWMMFMILFYQ
jgi:hypothetical protein